jgi:hypothetical protein
MTVPAVVRWGKDEDGVYGPVEYTAEQIARDVYESGGHLTHWDELSDGRRDVWVGIVERLINRDWIS